jgi:hypothetical protein
MGPSCRLLPHGGYALIPTVLTTLAWVASIFQDGCDYALVTGPIVQIISDHGDEVPWVEVGYSGYRTPTYTAVNGTFVVTYAADCLNYNLDRVQFDPAWNAGKAFAFLALVLGGGGTLFLWFSVCCVFSKATWRFAGYEVLLAAVFQAMAFLWFLNPMCQNKNTCALSWGSKADIAACALWGLAAAAIMCHYPVPPDSSLRSPRETTRPEIAITGLEQPYPYGHGASATSPASQISSRFNEGPVHIAAGLPLEGDASAIMVASPSSSSKIKPRSPRRPPSAEGHLNLKAAEVL